MGTRGLTAVIKDAKPVIAQYGQWDHYPSGQGAIILEFLRKETNRKKLLKQLPKLHFLTPEEAAAVDAESNWPKKYPWLSRDAGGKILEYVAKGHVSNGLVSEWEFAADSLFCEWAYVVDFDKGTFEIYRGFQKEPPPKGERFAGLELKDKEYRREKYYPVKLVKKYRLSRLPALQTFLRDLKEREPLDNSGVMNSNSSASSQSRTCAILRKFLSGEP